VQRTAAEVVNVLVAALSTGGDDAFDDFVSVPVADPALEAIRLKCAEVVLAPANVFEESLRSALVELRASSRERSL
jgi:hypothetical protein